MKKLNFDKDTALLPEVIAERVTAGNPADHGLTEADIQWFHGNVDARARYIYLVSEQWRRKLRGACGREYLETFIKHWFAGFVKNPVRYRKMYGNIVGQ